MFAESFWNLFVKIPLLEKEQKTFWRGTVLHAVLPLCVRMRVKVAMKFKPVVTYRSKQKMKVRVINSPTHPRFFRNAISRMDFDSHSIVELRFVTSYSLSARILAVTKLCNDVTKSRTWCHASLLTYKMQSSFKNSIESVLIGVSCASAQRSGVNQQSTMSSIFGD